MLIHALYQNNNLITDALDYEIYQGYYNDDLNWFGSNAIIQSGFTDNLTTLDTATENNFGNLNRSLKVYGFLRAKKTGLYRFFTRSKYASYLVLDAETIVDNGGMHTAQNVFGSVDLTAGNYYPVELYYGNQGSEYPPSALTGTNTTINGQIYNVGASSVSNSNIWNICSYTDDAQNYWRSNSVYAYGGISKTSGINTLTNLGTIYGEWIEYNLPVSISLTRFKINRARTERLGPKSIVIAGYNSSNEWIVIYDTGDLVLNQNKIISLDTPSLSYSRFRLIVRSAINNDYVEIPEWRLYTTDTQELSAGFKEPLDDGSNPVSTDLNDYITNGSNLAVYYDTNPSTSSGTFARNTYTYINPSLYGKFKVSILSIYFNRTNFVSNKNDLIYLYSPDLFNAFSGNTLIVIDEEPIDGQEDNSFCKSFCDGLEFECDLRGKIDLIPTRNLQSTTANDGFQFQKILIVLDVEKIEQIDI